MLAGYSFGGCLVSAGVGFVGALIGAWREPLPRHVHELVEVRGAAQRDVLVVRSLTFHHCAENAHLPSLRGHDALPVFDRAVGFDVLRMDGERERADDGERGGKGSDVLVQMTSGMIDRADMSCRAH